MSADITGYRFTIGCAHCGSNLTHRADGAVTTRAAAALGECVQCRAMWRVDVRMACVREPQKRLGSLEQHPWDRTAPFAGLIANLMEAEDELAARNG